MTTYHAPIDDVMFTLEHMVDAFKGDGPMEPGDLRPILEQAGAFASDRVAPINLPLDQVGAKYENGVVRVPEQAHSVYREWAEAGWNGISLPEDHGGAGLPVIAGTGSMEFFTSACLSLSMLPVLTQGAVDALEAHASEELKSRYLPKMVSGEWGGAMNLTEPQAGSDLGQLRTKAEPVGDGTYKITGQKIFITFGEHDLTENIVHLVLARLPDAPAGTKGISLFLVPKFMVNDDGSLGPHNDLRCAGIEHKMGIRASPTCMMAFGDHGGAIGYLVGEENKGLACMFTMMNRARLATGLEGVAVSERATQQALSYARERKQGRAAGYEGSAPIIAHPDVQRMLTRMRTLTAASRALAYAAASAIDRAEHNDDRDDQKYWDIRASWLTPVVKAFCTDAGCEVAYLGIQVHGGMGFIEETGVAQHMRDVRVTTIYEGTNAIQAIDLVTRKLPMGGTAQILAMVEDGRRLSAANVVWLAGSKTLFDAALDALESSTRLISSNTVSDQGKLYVAAQYLRLVGLTLGAIYLVKGGGAAQDKEGYAKSYWPSLARLYLEDVVCESPSLAASIRAEGRSSVDYQNVLTEH